MNKLSFSLFALYLAGFSFNTHAVASTAFSPEKVSIALSSGILTGGTAKEFSFDEEFGQLSQLDWSIKNTPIGKADITWDLHPRLSLSAKGWTTLASGQSHMDDYDWLNLEDRSQITDWSTHSNTHLNHANEFDLNMNFWMLNNNPFKLGLLAGYQENRFSWSAFGGHAKYSESDEDGDYIPDTAQSIEYDFADDAMVIGYKQKYSMPYLGLNTQYQFNKFEISAQLKYSPWVKAKDRDIHYERENLYLNKASKSSKYYGASINMGYNIIPSTKLFAEYNWSKYDMARSDTLILNVNEEPYLNENGGGISNKHQTVQVGIQYKF
ncbi:omptin family outer membrane protease [Acinetobacter larvae]|uniref:Protease n=1 Tax=Acinetobacter larvae TaxID=1789224 RepID=A0A1B2LYW5_9GAMM|nr:omptin family outer membrane protease [Acinetobacter larvae]AOA58148.1 hypothetical protein BFG52_07125 [Acinetobacter larvae]